MLSSFVVPLSFLFPSSFFFLLSSVLLSVQVSCMRCSHCARDMQPRPKWCVARPIQNTWQVKPAPNVPSMAKSVAKPLSKIAPMAKSAAKPLSSSKGVKKSAAKSFPCTLAACAIHAALRAHRDDKAYLNETIEDICSAWHEVFQSKECVVTTRTSWIGC